MRAQLRRFATTAPMRFRGAWLVNGWNGSRRHAADGSHLTRASQAAARVSRPTATSADALAEE
jgi:hypothetical protein